MDKFNETGMKDIDSLIEIVAELREITDKLTTALQQLQERLNTETGTEAAPPPIWSMICRCSRA